MQAAQVKFDTAGFLRQQPLFAGLKDSTLKNFSEYAVLRAEKKGTQLFSADAPNEQFFVVVSGWVKLFRETLDGEEAIIDILTAGQSFGEIGLSGSEPMPYGAAVVDDAQLVVLPRFMLAEEVMRNSVFGLAALQALTRQRIQRDLEIEHRTVQSAPQRIGCFLLKFCTGHAEEDAHTLHLPYDKAAIAYKLGMKPETFSRALQNLKADLGITVKGNAVTIPSVKALVDFTCSACSSSFPCKV